MGNKNFYPACLIVIFIFLIEGCTQYSVLTKNNFVYHNINFGPERNKDYKDGVMDACRTADGVYTKNHEKFKLNESYRVGWEIGRLNCKGEK